LANTAQARKRVRQNERRRLHNASQRSTLRTAIKRFLKSLQDNDAEAARSAYQQATSAIDRAVHKRLHHQNTAARLKKRLNARLKSLATDA